jgi:nickel/cobalt exporter
MTGLTLLVATAAGVGLVHTLIGPDHYLPFVVLARARGWSARRTAAITLACGGAHVLSSLLLAAIGIALGAGVTRLTGVESLRGELAAWSLVAVGTVYAAWGLHRALRGNRHVHLGPPPLAHAHAHERGAAHSHAHEAPHAHEHAHGSGRDHGHAHGEAPRCCASSPAADGARSLTPWALFLVFVLGPCEPLIPLLMAPAAAGSLAGSAAVALAFGGATLIAMVATVSVGLTGARLLPLGPVERYTHALAGLAILVSGLGVALLGW